MKTLDTTRELPIEADWDGPPQCRTCGMRDHVLFSALSNEEFAHIRQPIDEPRFDKGEQVYRAGDPAGHFYTVREGLVKLVHESQDGEEHILRLVKRGDVLGLEAVVDKQYNYTAVVLDNTLTCRIPLSVIIELDKSLPHFRQHMLTRWQHSVDEAEGWLKDLRAGSIRTRLTHLILRLAEGQPTGIIFLPTRKDLGKILSAKVETVSRTVAEFIRAGLLERVAPSRFRVDVDGLHQRIYLSGQ